MYTAIALYILFVLLLWINPRSKTIQFISLFYVFLLFAFCGDNPDYEAYITQYKYVDDFLDIREVGFTAYLRLLKLLKLPEQGIYVVTAVIYYSTFYYVFKRLSSNHFSYVLSFYMFFGLFLNVVQLRFTVCLVFVYWAFYALYMIKDTTKACLCYTVLILISSFFHFLGVVFLIFVITRFFNTKQVFVSVFCLIFVLQALDVIFGDFMKMYYLYDVVYSKFESYSESTQESSNRLRYIALTFEIICFYSIFYLSSNKRQGRLKSIEAYNTYGKNLVLMLFCTIPLMTVGGEVRRVITAIVPSVLSLSANCFITTRIRRLSYLLAALACYAIFRFDVADANIWLFSYGEYFETLFLSLFKNNLIIHSLIS